MFIKSFILSSLITHSFAADQSLEHHYQFNLRRLKMLTATATRFMVDRDKLSAEFKDCRDQFPSDFGLADLSVDSIDQAKFAAKIIGTFIKN